MATVIKIHIVNIIPLSIKSRNSKWTPNCRHMGRRYKIQNPLTANYQQLELPVYYLHRTRSWMKIFQFLPSSHNISFSISHQFFLLFLTFYYTCQNHRVLGRPIDLFLLHLSHNVPFGIPYYTLSLYTAKRYWKRTTCMHIDRNNGQLSHLLHSVQKR